MDGGDDFRSPQVREKAIQTLEAAMKDRPFQLNSRVLPSDPRQLEAVLFQSASSKEDYCRKINKILQMAGGQQQAQHHPPPAPYEMNAGGGVNAPPRGSMVGGPPQIMMTTGGMPNDPMQPQTQQQQAPPNATISTGPLPPQQQQTTHHYGVDGQGRLLPPPNPYGQQQQLTSGVGPQAMGVQATQGGGMMINLQGQPTQQQQPHLLQQPTQHRMMTRQAAPGMRMAQPGPAQAMIISDGGQRYGIPTQERPGDFVRLNQQQRFVRTSMPPQHSTQPPTHWAGNVNAVMGGGAGPPPISTIQQTISDTVVVTHFGPGGMPVRHHSSIATARNDFSASAYQPPMQQSYPAPRTMPPMMAQQPPSQQPPQAPASINAHQTSRFEPPPRMPSSVLPQYARHAAPLSQQLPPTPIMGPPSAPAASTPAGAYAPMQSPNTAGGAGPSPATAPGPAGMISLQEQSPVYAGSVESAQSRYNAPTEPSPAAQAHADGAVAEDPGYKAKIQELQMYLEPLKRMLEQHQKDGDRNSPQSQKLLRIIDIIEGKSKATLELLVKCEDTLKKMVHKEPPKTRESALCQPLFDVVASLAKAPNANQTLKRVFDLPSVDWSNAKRLWRPYLPVITQRLGWSKDVATKAAPKYPDDPAPRSIEAAFAAKMAQLGRGSSPDSATRADSDSDSSKVPVSIQREMASLEPRFRIMFDRGLAANDTFGPTKADAQRVIHVVCDLEDRRLPPVPALRLQIPSDYPVSSPKYDYDLLDYCGSPFLNSLREMLITRLTKLGSNCSITSLLDSWESTVRQACLSQ